MNDNFYYDNQEIPEKGLIFERTEDRWLEHFRLRPQQHDVPNEVKDVDTQDYRNIDDTQDERDVQLEFNNYLAALAVNADLAAAADSDPVASAVDLGHADHVAEADPVLAEINRELDNIAPQITSDSVGNAATMFKVQQLQENQSIPPSCIKIKPKKSSKGEKVTFLLPNGPLTRKQKIDSFLTANTAVTMPVLKMKSSEPKAKRAAKKRKRGNGQEQELKQVREKENEDEVSFKINNNVLLNFQNYPLCPAQVIDISGRYLQSEDFSGQQNLRSACRIVGHFFAKEMYRYSGNRRKITYKFIRSSTLRKSSACSYQI
ncbi:uncharacterized protein LOC107981524 isoform X1 [Nasonia vitripennis]|uniref:Uncharacterized protein n=1 Tax=Nasonia vitripennis TaxID=7425 RepID=A0A7M7TEL0_NASVI|nr:uncharacterized protein LOC107981524 isoform X1 [Nasonia vitripennis]